MKWQLSLCRLSCISVGTWWCPCLDITTTSSMPVTCWISPWVWKLSARSCPQSHTTANRQVQRKFSNIHLVSVCETVLTVLPSSFCQLMMTVGLLAVVVYLYTVIAFNFFRKFYNKGEEEDEPDMKCDDMMTVRHFLSLWCEIKCAFCSSHICPAS